MFDFVSSIRVFGSIAIGVLLILVNIPVFSVIIIHKRLRFVTFYLQRYRIRIIVNNRRFR
uniref:7TM GPCR serpentine receptor class x (Srx) domain-containing protein n=1 Tax=Ascaris lumbricoides TaxID=6252 RepID=A0A0M3IL55_ASCLU